MDFEDQKLIASIAAGANKYMAYNASLAPTRGEAERLGYIDPYGRPRRVDFKDHINNYTPGGPIGQGPQNFHQQFAPQNWQHGVPQVPGWNTPIEEDFGGIPQGNLNGPIAQIQPPAHLPVHQYMPQQQSYSGQIEGSGFVMPDYNNSPKQYLEDEQEFRDALIKEIKSQKKSLNKLNRVNEQLIVTVNSLKQMLTELSEKLKVELTPEIIIPTETIVDEVKDKS